MSFLSRSSSLLRCLRRDNVFLLKCMSTKQNPRMSKALRQKSTSFGEGGYILLVIPAAAFCLGTWQVQRRDWKLKLIADLEERTLKPAVPLPLNLDDLRDMEYQKVTVTGHFDHSREMYIGPRSNIMTDAAGGGLINAGGPSTGLNVVTPFILSDRNLTVLVNRGWIHPRDKDPSTRREGQIEGEVTLSGVVRFNDKRNPFMPKGNPKNDGYWLLRNVDEMSAVADTDPVFLDADRQSTVPGGPLGGQTRVTLRNEHMSYILTWYSLAFITFGMWFRRFRRPPPPDSAFNYIKKQS